MLFTLPRLLQKTKPGKTSSPSIFTVLPGGSANCCPGEGLRSRPSMRNSTVKKT